MGAWVLIYIFISTSGIVATATAEFNDEPSCKMAARRMKAIAYSPGGAQFRYTCTEKQGAISAAELERLEAAEKPPLGSSGIDFTAEPKKTPVVPPEAIEELNKQVEKLLHPRPYTRE